MIMYGQIVVYQIKKQRDAELHITILISYHIFYTIPVWLPLNE